MTDVLSVFADVEIPVDYASVQKYAILARSGFGKSVTLARLLEQFCDHELFFVCLDPVGIHFALRVGADGTTSGGKDVIVLGGEHGDVPLSPDDGAMIADVVVDHPGRYVLDVSGFESDAAQDRFAHAFAKHLFTAKKRARFPLLLALEEAESFIAQQPQPGQQQMLGAFSRIAKVGRNFGIGMALVSQRPQDVAKKVLNQTEVLVVKNLVTKLERDAVGEWIRYNGVDTDLPAFFAEIASFGVEEAYVYSPSWLRVFRRTTVLMRETFDSSSSARTGDVTVQPELRPLDVDALAGQLQEARERAKAADPRVLRDRVRQLEQQLAEAREARTEPEPERVEVEVPVIAAGDLNRLEGVVEEMRAALRDALTIGQRSTAAPAASGSHRTYPTPPPMSPGIRGVARPPDPPRLPFGARAARSSSSNGDGGEPGLSRAAADIGAVIACFPDGIDYDQIGLLTGKKPRGGSWNTAMSLLKNGGYTEGDGRRFPTPRLTEMFPDSRPPSGSDLVAMWRPKLSLPAVEVFDHVVSRYPAAVSYEEVAQATDRAPRGGSWNTAIKQLKLSGLVVVEGGTMRAKPELVG